MLILSVTCSLIFEWKRKKTEAIVRKKKMKVMKDKN